MKKAVLIFVVLFGFPAIGFASTIYVPGDFASIQDAIDASAAGDTIIVKPGVYVENIDFHGKAVTLRSEQGPLVTTIDGNQSGSCVVFENGEDLDSVIQGFTLTNGTGSLDPMGLLSGGGILVNGTSPTIKGNIIHGNTATTSRGGGISNWYGAAPLIINNEIYDNQSFDCGGGIYNRKCTPTIKYNIIHDNTALEYGGGINCSTYAYPAINSNIIYGNHSGEGGGGINAYYDSAPTILNNVIFDNSADLLGGGISILENASPVLKNNTLYGNSCAQAGGGLGVSVNATPVASNMIIWRNQAPVGQEIFVGVETDPAVLTISYSCVRGGQTLVHVDTGCTLDWGPGMIADDPLFVDPSQDDFHLTWDSPCRDTGYISKGTRLPPLDFELDPRVSGLNVDMGADEFHTHLYYTGTAVPGGSIRIKIVGEPGASPVTLGFSSGVQDPPQPSPHGDIFLILPLLKSWTFGSIPPSGVLNLGVTVPPAWVPGGEYPFQALEGFWSDPDAVLTNLMLIEVE